ncbi:hypothetical protein [Cyanothece sp. BG0011]|uniref:hypothetical protein n=1 Tax=Cyanothece sp. BG0011 TaxID=2082950 RepID=UPI0018E51500
MKKLLTILLVLHLLITLSACQNSDEVVTKENEFVDVAAISPNINHFMGKSVLVRNDIVETIGTRGFVLDKDHVFSGERILVIDPSKNLLTFSNNKTPEVLVKGTVTKLNLNEIETKYGLKLDADGYRKYEKKPVIIAEFMMLSPDPGDINDNVDFYNNQPLAIKGEVEAVTNYGLVILDEEKIFSAKDLIVVQPKPRIELHEDAIVIVYGVLRPFIPGELVQAYNLDWDLSTQEEIEIEYSQKYVLVANKIQLLEQESD